MKYEDHLEQCVENYCKLNNIRFIRGYVPVEHQRKLEDFIRNHMELERRHNRKIEEENKWAIKNIIDLSKYQILESPIEQFLYVAIEADGIGKYCTPQYKIGTKRVDLAFPDAFLAVECDGKEYHFSDKRQIANDQERDKYLARKGWRVLHFDGLIIRRNVQKCIEEIRANLEPFLNLNLQST